MRWLLSLLSAGCLFGASSPEMLDRGYRHMYNLEFNEAHSTFEEYQRQWPADPLGPVSNAAAYLFAEFDRLNILQSEFFTDDDNFFFPKKLTANPAAREGFNRETAQGDRLADQIIEKDPNDRDALFARLMNIGLRSDYAGLIEKRRMESVKGLKAARLLAEKLLTIDPQYYDAHIAIGVENYILSLKPAPVRWVLQWNGAETDKRKGLDNVKQTAEKGRFLRPFARLLMAVAALRDKDTKTAIGILAELQRQFPHNRLYSEELARLRGKS